MQLEGKQKRFLRAEAHEMNPLFQIGKNGVTEEMLQEFEEALEKRELMKVKLLQNTLWEPKEAAEFIEEHSSIQVVQVIGSVLILFKPSSKEKYQRFSNQLPR